MVTEAMRDYIARAALKCDTLMSRAFLRALGIDVPEPLRAGEVVVVGDPRYRGIAWCMANRDEGSARE